MRLSNLVSTNLSVSEFARFDGKISLAVWWIAALWRQQKQQSYFRITWQVVHSFDASSAYTNAHINHYNWSPLILQWLGRLGHDFSHGSDKESVIEWPVDHLLHHHQVNKLRGLHMYLFHECPCREDVDRYRYDIILTHQGWGLLKLRSLISAQGKFSYFQKYQGHVSIIKTVFSRYGIPMLKIRRSRDRLIFNMEIPILVRRHLYINKEAPPCVIVGVSFIFDRCHRSWTDNITKELIL